MNDYARRAEALRLLADALKDQYDVSLKRYAPDKHDDLDRHYVIVTGDGWSVSVQYHQRFPEGTPPSGSWKTSMQTPEREAERLDITKQMEQWRLGVSRTVAVA